MAMFNGSNPTKLRVGASGTLEGRACRVLGRVVLSTADGYKWQEYRLQFADATEATLVFESGDWKLFRLFEPSSAMTLPEAAAVRADDIVTIEGRSITVTYVGKSRVVYLEGQPPEGVELGDRADYFNAEPARGKMVVVSWTGEEMEFYEGYGLGERTVVRAFNLPQPAFLVRMVDAFRRLPLNFGEVMFAGLILVFVLVGILDNFERDAVFDDPPPKRPAPAAMLPDHGRGKLGAHTYTVVGHTVVEVSRPGASFDRHEYAVTDETGAKALLVQSVEGNAVEWQLLVPATVAPAFTPLAAAQVPMGKVTTAEGQQGEAVLWLLKVGKVQGEPTSWPAVQQYGFMVRLPDHFLHARWTENFLQMFVGQRVAVNDVSAAFQAPEVGKP